MFNNLSMTTARISPHQPTRMKPAPQVAAPLNLDPATIHQPVIKVVGLGGGGSNAVNRMIELGLSGVDFIVANTDHQALQNSLAPVKIQLGPRLTRGLGAGGKPAIGQAAAEESFRELGAALVGADMVFLTAGMGGGTGTGSISVAARISRALGAVTIAIVTTPFSFERGTRQRNASEGLAHLRPNTDTLIAIPNDRLLYVAPRDLPLEVAFHMADDVLRQAVQGITELVTESGLINVDFAHIRHIMKLGGGALMSIGQGRGEGKARQAIEQALHHPLLETASAGGERSLDNAAGILVNFTGGEDLGLYEIQEALTFLQQQTGPQAEVVMGVIQDERMQDRVQAILVVTGLGATTLEEALAGVKEKSPAIISTTTPPMTPVATTAATTAAIAPTPIIPAAAHSDITIAMTGNLDVPTFLRRPR